MLMPNSTKPTVLSVRGLTKSYGNSIHALRGIDIDVKEGEFLVILGPSGAGKIDADALPQPAGRADRRQDLP